MKYGGQQLGRGTNDCMWNALCSSLSVGSVARMFFASRSIVSLPYLRRWGCFSIFLVLISPRQPQQPVIRQNVARGHANSRLPSLRVLTFNLHSYISSLPSLSFPCELSPCFCSCHCRIHYLWHRYSMKCTDPLLRHILCASIIPSSFRQKKIDEKVTKFNVGEVLKF